MKFLIKSTFKYLVYYPAVLLRGEWIWKHLYDLKKSERSSKEELEAIQLKKFNNILKASTNSFFYSDKGLPDHIKSLENIKDLPALNKSDLRSYAEKIQTRKDPLLFTTKTSGGSTGAPITIKKPAAAMGQELAAAWRGYSWAKIDVGDLQARFWGVPMTSASARRAKLIDFVARRIRLSAFQFSKMDLASYVNILERSQPDYFYGYVSMIKEVSGYLKEHKADHNIRPRSIITTSEVLTDTDRKEIEETFKCKVYNEYGCGEVGTIAHECDHGSMHINMENVFLEIVDDAGKSLGDDQEGEIVVTDLNNFLMPLIRYRLGDYGSISSNKCPCGRTLKVLKNIKGRAYDFIENEKGERFHGEFFLYIVEELKSSGIIIDGVQFIFSSGKMEIKIVSDQVSFDKSKEYIYKRLSESFSKTLPITFSKVDIIQREPSGKLRVIKRID